MTQLNERSQRNEIRYFYFRKTYVKLNFIERRNAMTESGANLPKEGDEGDKEKKETATELAADPQKKEGEEKDKEKKEAATESKADPQKKESEEKDKATPPTTDIMAFFLKFYEEKQRNDSGNFSTIDTARMALAQTYTKLWKTFPTNKKEWPASPSPVDEVALFTQSNILGLQDRVLELISADNSIDNLQEAQNLTASITALSNFLNGTGNLEDFANTIPPLDQQGQSASEPGTARKAVGTLAMILGIALIAFIAYPAAPVLGHAVAQTAIGAKVLSVVSGLLTSASQYISGSTVGSAIGTFLTQHGATAAASQVASFASTTMGQIGTFLTQHGVTDVITQASAFFAQSGNYTTLGLAGGFGIKEVGSLVRGKSTPAVEPEKGVKTLRDIHAEAYRKSREKIAKEVDYRKIIIYKSEVKEGSTSFEKFGQQAGVDEKDLTPEGLARVKEAKQHLLASEIYKKLGPSPAGIKKTGEDREKKEKEAKKETRKRKS